MYRTCSVLIVLFVTGCGGGRAPPVEFVVPKEFTGPIWIVLDPNGQEIPLVGDRFQVVIPADGVLRVQTFQPFDRWHQSYARYDDGSVLREMSGDSPDGPQTLALRGGVSAVTRRGGIEIRWISFFVGTAKEYGERPAMDFPPGVDR